MIGRSTPIAASGTLRVLAALLSYPDPERRGHLTEMGQIMHREGALHPARLGELDALLERLRRTDQIEVEADYVQLFDRGRQTSLHLFEHVHGDSRDRGPAMIDLAQTYEKAGLLLAPGELPDYLPAVLEFVSTQPPREAKAFLGEIAHILNIVLGALQKRESTYASVFAALLELSGEKVQAVNLPVDVPMDESWAEPVVFDGCSSKGQDRPGQPQPIHMIRRNKQPEADSGAATAPSASVRVQP